MISSESNEDQSRPQSGDSNNQNSGPQYGGGSVAPMHDRQHYTDIEIVGITCASVKKRAAKAEKTAEE